MSKKPAPAEPTAPPATPAPASAVPEEATAVSTEPKAVLTSTAPAASPAPSAATSSPPALPTAQDALNRKPSKCAGRGRFVAMLVGVLAVSAALGLVLQQAIEHVADEAEVRHAALAASLQSVQQDAQQAQALARTQAESLTQLQRTLAQVHSQYQALADAWAHMGTDSDEAMRVNDIEQLLQQASQQLQLGGHVGNAIIALQAAQARITPASPGGVERPEQVLLRQALADDLARLRAVPQVDVAALVAQVDRLMGLTARAPLWVADGLANTRTSPSATNNAAPSNAPTEAAPPDGSASWWQRAGYRVADWSARALAGAGRELRGLVSVQRVADPNALLLAPDQAEQLRATLRMRLLAAQVALLMRQPAVWQSELASVGRALASYYDPQVADTAAAVQLAQELERSTVTVALPDLAVSVKALAVLRAALRFTPAPVAGEANHSADRDASANAGED